MANLKTCRYPVNEQGSRSSQTENSHSNVFLDGLNQGLTIDDPMKLQQFLLKMHVEPCLATIKRYETLILRQAGIRKFTLMSRVSVRATRAALTYFSARAVLKLNGVNEAQAFVAAERWKDFARAMTTPVEVCSQDQCKDQGFLRLARYFEKIGIQVVGPDNGIFPRRVGRVQKIRNLPKDWREVVIENVKTEIPNLKEALIVLALTGCRPEELKFATVLKTDPSHMAISVCSAKQLKGVRRGGVFSMHGYILDLEKIAGSDSVQEQYPFIDISPKRIENLLARMSRKLEVLKKLRRPICASAFRNQTASDAKAAGFSDEEISILLGHTTNSQQLVYGKARYGASGGKVQLPVSLLDSHEVRMLPMKYPRQAEVDHRQWTAHIDAPRGTRGF